MARESGLRVALVKSLGETVYRRLDVVELLLPVDVGEPDPRFELRFLTPADEPDYAALHRGAGDDLAERLASGHRCFGGWLDGRLVATRWFATGVASIEYLGRSEPLADGELYLYELFTAPDIRGRGVTRAAGTGAVAALSAEGAHRLVGAVLPENASVRSAYLKGGWRTVGRIGFVRVGPFRRGFGRLSARS